MNKKSSGNRETLTVAANLKIKSQLYQTLKFSSVQKG